MTNKNTAVKFTTQTVTVRKDADTMNNTNTSIKIQTQKLTAMEAIRKVAADAENFPLEVQIEHMAKLLKDYPELNPDKKYCYLKRKQRPLSEAAQAFDNLMLDYILQHKNMFEFSSKAQAENCILIPVTRKRKYAGPEYLECLIHAKKYYGFKDKVSGEKVPFLQIFNAMLKLKKKDILDKDNRETNAIRYELAQRKLHRFLKDAYKAKGIVPGKYLNGYLSKSKLDKIYAELQADAKFKAQVEAILSKQYEERADKGRGEEESGPSGIDRADAEFYWGEKCAADRVLYMLEQGRRKVAEVGSKNMRKDYEAYITLKSNKYLEGFLFEDMEILMEELDMGLLLFLEQGEIPHDSKHRDLDAEAYAAYKGIAYDTARKRLNVIEELMEGLAVKSRRASVAINKAKRREERRAKRAEAQASKVGAVQGVHNGVKAV